MQVPNGPIFPLPFLLPFYSLAHFYTNKITDSIRIEVGIRIKTSLREKFVINVRLKKNKKNEKKRIAASEKS